MKSNIYTIFRKELARFFKDKRLVITTLLLPGLMIFIMYTFMGNMIRQQFGVADSYVSEVYIKNLPSSINSKIDKVGISIKTVDGDLEIEKKLVSEKEIDLVIDFPKNFDKELSEYKTGEGRAPQIAIFYNSARQESESAYRIFRSILDEYETELSNKFDVNTDEQISYDLAAKEDITGKLFGSMLPMLLMIFIWSGCVAVAPESIAGEKERGTIATLLVTPMSRQALALGKIFALSIIAFLSGVSSFIGTFASLPAMYEGMSEGINASFYSAKDFAFLFIIIISTTILMVAFISVLSAFAKSVKETATIISPFMIVIMVMTFLPMFAKGEEVTPITMFLIPLYNSVLCMNGIFKFAYLGANVAVSVAVNIVFTGILVLVLTKMFDSEKIMFSK
ncbi:MAG: ABC transporter permease [Catonella sp.]|uniref:ABC transporter permease n=1 Tax=Catonella sp. TaxID=2382125 RepID=UPI003FA06419